MGQFKEVALDFGFKSTSEKKKEVGKSKSGKYSFHKIISVHEYVINFFNFSKSIYLCSSVRTIICFRKRL